MSTTNPKHHLVPTIRGSYPSFIPVKCSILSSQYLMLIHDAIKLINKGHPEAKFPLPQADRRQYPCPGIKLKNLTSNRVILRQVHFQNNKVFSHKLFKMQV